MFTNNRLDFYNNKTYEEKTHASALSKGIPSFVVKGLELTGTTLTSGIFTNTGTFGQLGNEGETLDITTLDGWTSDYTGYIVVKSTLNGNASTSYVELSTTRKDTDQRDTSNIKYFTIYQLENGEIVQDFRHINYIKEYRFEQGESGAGWFRSVLNGFKSNEFNLPALVGNVLSVNDQEPDVNGEIQIPMSYVTEKDLNYIDGEFGTTMNAIISGLINRAISIWGTAKQPVIYIKSSPATGSAINPILHDAMKFTITSTDKFSEPAFQYLDLKIECVAIDGFNSVNSTHFVTINKNTGGHYKFTYDYDTTTGIDYSSIQNEKGEYGDNYINEEEKIIAVDYVGQFMTSGQTFTSEITIPTNFKVTEVRYVWSQFDDTTNQALLTGTTTQLVSGGKTFDGISGLFYDIHTSGFFDPLMVTMSSNGADPNLPGNIKSCSLLAHKINYSTKKLTINGGRYEDVDNFYRKLVLNTIMIVGEYVNYQPTAVAIHLSLNPSLTLEDVIASGIFSVEEINQYNEIMAVENED